MNYHALVPAAGTGSRMGALSGRATPKQYLPLAGKPMIWHALATLCAAPAFADVFVVLAPDDDSWPAEAMQALGDKLHVLRRGGETRVRQECVWGFEMVFHPKVAALGESAIAGKVPRLESFEKIALFKVRDAG